MANNSVLKAAIADVVKQNGANAITGDLLQQSLLSMIDALGGNYQYAGIATPTTNPGTPDQNVFYLAVTAGTYINFGGIVLADGDVAVIKGSGATWTKDVTGVATSEAVIQLKKNIALPSYNAIFGRQGLTENLTSVQVASLDYYQRMIDTSVLQIGANIDDVLLETPWRRMIYVDIEGFTAISAEQVYAADGLSILITDSDKKILAYNEDTNNSEHSQYFDFENVPNAKYAFILTNASYTSISNITGIITEITGLETRVSDLEDNQELVGKIEDAVFENKKNSLIFTTTSGKLFPNTLAVGDTINLDSPDYSNPYRRIGVCDCSQYYRYNVLLSRVVSLTDYPLVVLADADNKVLKIYKHLWQDNSHLGSINITIDNPNATKLYFVCLNNDDPGYVPIVVASQISIENKINIQNGKKQKGAFSISPTNATISDGIYCGFLNSNSVKLTGTGNATIVLTLQSTIISNVLSVGVLLPWAFQNVAKFTISDGRSAFVINKAETDSRTESGKAYYLQGDHFNRISFNADRGISVITITIESVDSWEFEITKEYVVNDTYSKTPICVLYDGGTWDGIINYNGTTVNQWQLHEALNIPYGICFANNTQYDETNINAKNDISSGLAQIVLREADAMAMFQDTDIALTDKLVELYGDTESFTNRICVLGQHVFDKKVLRCLRKANTKIVRGQTCQYYGNLSPMGKDAEMCVISGCALSNIIDIDLLGLPVILWAHGVGAAPSGDTSGMYNNHGDEAVQLFTYLTKEQDAGRVLLLSPSDFVEYVKTNNSCLDIQNGI